MFCFIFPSFSLPSVQTFDLYKIYFPTKENIVHSYPQSIQTIHYLIMKEKSHKLDCLKKLYLTYDQVLLSQDIFKRLKKGLVLCIFYIQFM